MLFAAALKTYFMPFIETSNSEVSSFDFFTLLVAVIILTYFIHHLIIAFYECVKSRVNIRTSKLQDINNPSRKKTFQSFYFISGIH